MRFSTQTFVSRVFQLHGNEYIVQGEYLNNHTPISIKHSKCNTVFTPRPSDFLGTPSRSGTQCPSCSRPSKKFSNTKIKDLIYNSTNGEYSLIGEYVNTHTVVLIRHNKCNHSFNMRPNNFLIKLNRCPLCTSSKGEDIIMNFLNTRNIAFEKEVNVPELGKRRFDFKVFIDDDFFFIEYDGRFHFEPCGNSDKSLKKFESQKKSDKLKNNYCMQNKIPLLRIPYTELKDLSDKLEMLFNDYLLSESTLQANGNGNKNLSQYFIL